ncbi:MAG TPA: glycosyltransferase family 2 protein [Firmicutes bacterium]|nr:glycosyltransferase family 2 protein [Bacillota bacterium]
MPEAEISIITVNYKRADLTDRLLSSIAKFAPPCSHEVIMVDNASGDGSVEFLQPRHPSVKFLQLEKNIGFGAGNNRGVEKSSGRILFLINPDSFLKSEIFSKPVEYLDNHPDVGILGLKVFTPDGVLEQTARGFPDASTGLFGRSTFLGKLAQRTKLGDASIAKKNLKADPDATEPYEVDWVSGAAMAIRRDCFEKISGFDEDFFMYWEDADLCYRALKAGYKTMWFPGAEIFHSAKGCSSKDPVPAIRYFHDSAYLYLTKHISPKPSFLRGFAWCALNFRAAVLTAKTRKE